MVEPKDWKLVDGVTTEDLENEYTRIVAHVGNERFCVLDGLGVDIRNGTTFSFHDARQIAHYRGNSGGRALRLFEDGTICPLD